MLSRKLERRMRNEFGTDESFLLSFDFAIMVGLACLIAIGWYLGVC